METITLNRKAYHDYEILDRVEAGIALTGTEIKSVRAGRVNLRHAFARPENGEIWLLGSHIARYDPGSYLNHDPGRPRKLLLHREQIAELMGKVSQRGLTLVPLRMYLKNGLAKVELGLARGRRLHDKRAYILRREAEREMDRAIKFQKLKKA
ncbi:MAG TPA: SsrA-binding protein SmpB [Dehalococcoidia bacterium]|nr:SsrA-binding protein SmpB [Dehalococcoidia bacterium]